MKGSFLPLRFSCYKDNMTLIKPKRPNKKIHRQIQSLKMHDKCDKISQAKHEHPP